VFSRRVRVAVRFAFRTHIRSLVPAGSLAGVAPYRSGVEALVVARRWMLRRSSTCLAGRAGLPRRGYERGHGLQLAWATAWRWGRDAFQAAGQAVPDSRRRQPSRSSTVMLVAAALPHLRRPAAST
jgi:hypothetical protein